MKVQWQVNASALLFSATGDCLCAGLIPLTGEMNVDYEGDFGLTLYGPNGSALWSFGGTGLHAAGVTVSNDDGTYFTSITFTATNPENPLNEFLGGSFYAVVYLSDPTYLEHLTFGGTVDLLAPLPGTATLFLTGLGAIALFSRRRDRNLRCSR
jgi:hypothetical protein